MNALARGVGAVAIGFVAIVSAFVAARARGADLTAAVEHFQRGEFERAEAIARQAESDPAQRAAAHAILGSIRLAQQRPAEAARWLSQAVAAQPELLGARLSLAQAYLLENRPELAEEQFRFVVEREPTHVDARAQLARLLTERRAFEQALEVARPIGSELRASPDGLLLLAAANIGASKSEDARRLAGDWRSLPGAEPAWTRRFAELLLAGGLPKEAVAVLEDLRGDGTTDRATLVALGNAYFAEGRLDSAERVYEQALALQEDAPVLLRAALTAERRGELEKALSLAVRAKRAAPQDAEAVFVFGRICLRMDLLPDAVEALEEAVSLRPEHAPSIYALASARVGVGEYADARALIGRLIERAPREPRLLYSIGSIHYLENNLIEAEKYLSESLAIDPEQPAAYYYAGLTAERRGDSAGAVERLREAIRRDPSHAPAHEALGAALLRLRRLDEARDVLEKAIELDPKSVKANYQLGLLLRRMGDSEEAREQLAAALKLQEEERERERVQLRLLNPH